MSFHGLKDWTSPEWTNGIQASGIFVCLYLYCRVFEKHELNSSMET